MPFAAAAIPAIIGGVGSSLGGGLLGKIFGGAAAGTAGAADFMRAREQQQVINQILSQTSAIEKLTPEQIVQQVMAAAIPGSTITAGAERAALPLDIGLVENIGNVVSSQLGERGLAQAPGMMAAMMGEALAPYEQNLLQQALQATEFGIGQGAQAEYFHLDEPLKYLALAADALSGGGGNLASVLAALKGGRGGGGIIPASLPSPIFMSPDLSGVGLPPDLTGTGLGGMDVGNIGDILSGLGVGVGLEEGPAAP